MLNAERTLIFVMSKQYTAMSDTKYLQRGNISRFQSNEHEKHSLSFFLLKPNFDTTFHLTIVTYYEQYREPLCSNNIVDFITKRCPKRLAYNCYNIREDL